MIRLENITKNYNGMKVLDISNISFNSDLSVIVGPSGSGKTTLLNILGTITEFDTGIYKCDETIIGDLSKKQMQSFRRTNISFVFQEANLIGALTAQENITLGINEKEDNDVIKLCKQLKIDHLLNRQCKFLSGGEQQRVNIARALIRKTKYIFADEPTGSLDSANSQQVYSLFKYVAKQFDVKVIIVSHDLKACEYADYIYLLENGQIKTILDNSKPYSQEQIFEYMLGDSYE